MEDQTGSKDSLVKRRYGYAILFPTIDFFLSEKGKVTWNWMEIGNMRISKLKGCSFVSS